MDPLKKIRELIVQRTHLDEGKIVSIDLDALTFLISTKTGVQTVTGNPDLFKVGDTVKVVNGVITAKKSVETSLVVHVR